MVEEKVKLKGFASVDIWNPKLQWVRGSVLLRECELRGGCLWLKIDLVDKESNFGVNTCQIRITVPERGTEILLNMIKRR